jgi:hypothetical protein
MRRAGVPSDGERHSRARRDEEDKSALTRLVERSALAAIGSTGEFGGVEALSSEGADESLGEGVGLRCPDGRADHTDALGVEHCVEGAPLRPAVMCVLPLSRRAAWRASF